MMTNAIAGSLAVRIAERSAGRVAEGVFARRPHAVLQRSFLALRTANAAVFLSGFVEPVIFLVAFGYGLGGFVGTVDVHGEELPYAVFLAPALLASSAMNGAMFDSTFGVFFKMNYSKIYHAMMSTSLGSLDVALGEMSWSMLRGGSYAVGFLIVTALMGLVTSWWALACIPAVVLIAFAFSSVGMAITSYFTSFQQLNWLVFWMLPMFLFSGTFFPVTNYPDWAQAVIAVTPLAQAISLCRSLALGEPGWATVVALAYFACIAAVGVALTSRRLSALFQR